MNERKRKMKIKYRKKRKEKKKMKKMKMNMKVMMISVPHTCRQQVTSQASVQIQTYRMVVVAARAGH